MRSMTQHGAASCLFYLSSNSINQITQRLPIANGKTVLTAVNTACLFCINYYILFLPIRKGLFSKNHPNFFQGLDNLIHCIADFFICQGAFLCTENNLICQ